MGTNYYIRTNVCEHCNRYEEVHLGKSSGGWQFSFQYNGGEFYKNIKEMKDWLEDKKIYNEYDKEVSFQDFWELVESKKRGLNHTDETQDTRSFKIDGYSFTDCYFC